jgi:hypothetical protein
MANQTMNGVLSHVIEQANAIADEAQQTFGALSATQLNWKPGPEQWSVAQCFDHLIVTNRSYFPTFEKIVKGEKRNTLWERMPYVSKFWGRMLLKMLDPDSSQRVKAPSVFRPSSSDIDAQIINRFVTHQHEVVGFMSATKGFDLERIKLTSPAAGVITYSLMDCYRIIVTHERRHFKQAERVMAASEFPR